MYLESKDYPMGTAIAVKFEKLIRREKPLPLSERMSSRMIRCASVLKEGEFLGWQMMVPVKGLVKMDVFGSGALCKSDLEWITERTGRTEEIKHFEEQNIAGAERLYELYLPGANRQQKGGIGFGAETAPGSDDAFSFQWPSSYSTQFGELIQAMQVTGGCLRVVVGYANTQEQLDCRKNMLRSFDIHDIDMRSYIGCPVKTRVLLRLPDRAAVRLRTVLGEAVPQARLRELGTMDLTKTAHTWKQPLEEAAVLPDYAARILLMEPELQEPVTGILFCDEPVKPIPASHKSPRTKGAVTIGRAIDAAGYRRKVSIGEMDIRRHYQIVGQTGTGKSTLLVELMLSAIQQGYGLTFFDPHGSTIDTLLRSVPEEYAHRIRVVRVGDAEHPVPLNIWDSNDPIKEERNISDLCELFADIFDPNQKGFVGPRYERWLSTFAKASIAFLGSKASLESIAVISQSQDNMLKLSKALIRRYPELVETIKQEYGTDKSSDFQNTLNWYLCKFQRLTSVEQLRKTLGAGANALDFHHSIDTDQVTLIDLASPVIGTHAARIVGTLTLMKLWNAALARQNREQTHMVVVDEASLFQTNPMPRMLAEARKFGVSMVLSHQHSGQLTSEIRDALEGNSANFTAFRLSPRDAVSASIRLDDPKMSVALTRLDAYKAITTLSVDGRQTAPFTLDVSRPKLQKNGEKIAAYIQEQSVQTLFAPYADRRAMTALEIQNLLDQQAEKFDKVKEARDHGSEPALHPEAVPETDTKPTWLVAWKEDREKRMLKQGKARANDQF